MKNLFKFLSSFLIHLLFSINHVGATDYFFKRISIEHGLSHLRINTIYRDYKGILWIGTQQGLNKVDRNDLKTYFHDNKDSYSIAGNFIYSLNEDEEHSLWIASNGGLSLYNRKKDCFETKINNHIQSITNIKTGVLFGGYTAIYFYRYKTKEIKRLPIINKDPNRRKTNKDYLITHLTQINDTLVLAGTEVDGIFLYNLNSHEFIPFKTNETKKDFLLQGMLFDQEANEIYASEFQNGVFCYDLSGKLKKHYTTYNSGLSHNIVLDIKKYNNSIWFATDGSGIDILNTQTECFENIRHIPGDINSLPVNSITWLYVDSNNNLWAGSVRDGVFLFKKVHIRTFKDITLGSNKGLSEKVIISLFEDKKGSLWIGTDGGGINMFNPQTKTFTHHLNTYGDKISSITGFSETELLVSVYGKGLFIYNTNTQRYNPFIIQDYETNKEECRSGFSPNCYRISAEKILILSKNGYLYNIENHSFKKLDYDEGIINVQALQWIDSDNSKSFMIKGNIIYTLDNEEGIIKRLLILNENEYINAICYEKNTNKLWIASTEGLKFYDINRRKVEKIETNVFSRAGRMCFDKGYLWINALNLLFSYDIKNNKFMIWDDSDGFLPNDILTVKLSQSGDIYMGGSSGLVKINKDIDRNDDPFITFNLQEIELNGKVYAGHNQTESSRMRIPQNYSSLKIRIGLNEKDLFRHILFRYRISNQKHNFLVESYSNILSLTSLATGKYNIYVSCMTKSGSWTPETLLVTFDILSPWYKRTWFILSIIFSVLGLIVLLGYLQIKKNKRKLEWEKAMHVQELNEDKIQFLTNVSHELRTPLTLIYAPLKRMVEKKEISMEKLVSRKQIESIYRQADHMKNIINWILDYDRNTSLSSNRLTLSLVDINHLIRSIIYDFDQEFKAKHIDIKLALDEELKPIEMDDTKIRVVISNLLMNALKFSDPYMNVTVRSFLNGDFVRIQVEDEGIGLQEVKVDKLFTRFYQGDHGRKGSGIGLAYCKELIEKHSGNIGIKENKRKGIVVYFDLPYKTVADNKFKSFCAESYSHIPSEKVAISNEFDTSNCSVLIVDDNKDFQLFLENELKFLFKRVLKAKNGAEAMDIMINNQPDILISDVMMPIMDGYQLCKNVKENIEISHIPVVLLTAKSDDTSRKTGYKVGADVYLSKPFDVDLLLSVIQNQLKSKKAIRQKFQQGILPIPPEQATISNADEQFMTKLNKLIKDNYSNTEFDVSVIMDSLAMSRASLYNKMKHITGLGINTYINKYRIAVACSLLADTNKTIADIAFETGFTSQRYFSTVFKQITDKTPSNYRIEKRKDKSNALK